VGGAGIIRRVLSSVFPIVGGYESVILRERAFRCWARFEDTVRIQRMAGIVSIGLLLAIPFNAQTTAPKPAPPLTRMEANPPSGDVEESQQRQAREMAKKANLERQALLKADTDKLLKLAVELKDSVDKSSENVLSLDVLKKAEEIEKLAHSVKDKMKGPN
jgi:hypothetical protein